MFSCGKPKKADLEDILSPCPLLNQYGDSLFCNDDEGDNPEITSTCPGAGLDNTTVADNSTYVYDSSSRSKSKN